MHFNRIRKIELRKLYPGLNIEKRNNEDNENNVDNDNQINYNEKQWKL